jgi:hypothetical protein
LQNAADLEHYEQGLTMAGIGRKIAYIVHAEIAR